MLNIYIYNTTYCNRSNPSSEGINNSLSDCTDKKSHKEELKLPYQLIEPIGCVCTEDEAT